MMTIQIDAETELKQLEKSDSKDIFKTIDSQREYLGKWLPFVEFTKEITDTKKFVDSVVNAPEDKFEYVFAIRRQKKFIGLIGFKDTDKLNQKTEIGYWLSDKYQKQGKLLCDVLTKHREIFTIGITGTNGKTTTVTMIRKILEKAGYNVLIGGNGGGGFEGYYDLILEAEKGDYDVMLIEVCDMTLDFCNYCFDFDIVGLTNIGNDHMNVHKSIENYIKRDS